MLATVKFVVPGFEIVSTFCELELTGTLPKFKLPARAIAAPTPVPDAGSDFVPLVADELTVTVPLYDCGAVGENWINAVAVPLTGIEAVVKVVLKPAGSVMLDTFNVAVPALEMVIDSCAEEPTRTLPKFKLPLTAMAFTLGAALTICGDNVRITTIPRTRANEDSFWENGLVDMISRALYLTFISPLITMFKPSCCFNYSLFSSRPRGELQTHQARLVPDAMMRIPTSVILNW
jgi:hypothetical protein